MQRFLFLLLSLAAAADALATITGSVFTDQGKPLANATVRAYRAEDHAARRERLASGAERKAIATTATGEDGAFSLDQAGVVELLVTREGYTPRRQFAIAGDFPAVFSLTAIPMRTLKVTAGGKGVAKARVYALEEWGLSETDLGSTNEAGELAVPDPKLWTAALLIVHPDYAPRLAGDTLRVELTGDTTIRGRVIGADGKPVAKALLLSGGWPLGRSADDGTFTVHSAAPALVAVTADAEGSGKGEIRLEATGSIGGTVVDADGRPIAGLPVSAARKRLGLDTERLDLRTAVTDEKGRFRITGLRALEQHVQALPVGDLEFEPATVDLRRGQRPSLALKATRAERIRGVVLNERKEPVGGAIVTFFHPQAPLAYVAYGDQLAVTRTAVDGSFRLPSPDVPIGLAALHPDYAAAVTEPLEADRGKRKPLVITLPDGVEVSGLVVGPDDKPVAGAAIALVENSTSAMPMPIDAAFSSGTATALWESAADGTFRLRLNEKPHDVTVRKEGYAPARMAGFVPGRDPLRVVLARGVSIEGRVVKKGGGAVGEGVIFLSSEDGAHTRGSLAADGSFAITSLAPGRYSLHVVGEQGGMVEKSVTAPASNVVIELEPTVQVTGTVIDKTSGTPVPSYRVYAGYGSDMQEIEGGAPFVLEVPAGPAEIRVEAPGYVRATREVLVDPEKPTAVEFALVRGRTIRGRVVDPNGSPLGEVRVVVESYDVSEPAETGDDGEFQLDGVTPDAMRVTFGRKGFVSRRVEVPVDRTGPLEVVLTRGRSTTGRVIDESGQPVEGASVDAFPAMHDGDPQNAVTDAAGVFRMEGLSEGRHSFQAEKAGYRDAELRDVDVTKAPIVLTLRGTGATGTIRGTVSGFSGGSWLYGRVSVRSLEEEGGAQGLIQRDGTYRVEGAPSGEVEIRANASSARREMSSRRVSARVPAGGEVEVNLAFNDNIVVSGVVTVAGQPAAERHVSFYNNGGSWRGFTDENGRYEIGGIEPGRYTVNVTHSSRSYTTTYEVAGSATFDIAADLTRMEGQVVDTDGVAIAGAKIEAARAGSTWTDHRAESDAAGAFVLEVPAGAYEVRASKKGFATAVAEAETGAAPLLLRLQPSEGLRVRLVDARDNTTLGGYAVARDARGVQLGRASDQEIDGSMRIAVAPGSYRISVSADGYATQTVQATAPGSGELRIGLTPGGTLIVRTERDATEVVKLVMPNGEEYVRCECNGIAEIRLTGKTTRIEHVAPGAYLLQVISAGGKVLSSAPVQITEGGTTVAEVK